jgi:hypothetical protein
MAIVLIGIDDTDNETSPGTGQLARRLGQAIEQRGAKLLGITRHQFLVDDRIAYTSHNSGACLAVEWNEPLGELEFAIGLIAEWSANGSDPGICIAVLGEVPTEVMEWGWAATREVLTMDRAVMLAKAYGICLRPLGGSGEGIIGALASVGLRADGNEGRFLDLPGLRMVAEFVDLSELTQIGIEVDHRLQNGVKIAREGAKYKTLNWVRPRLVGGRPVWPVEWSEDECAWIPVDRKKSRPLEWGGCGRLSIRRRRWDFGRDRDDFCANADSYAWPQGDFLDGPDLGRSCGNTFSRRDVAGSIFHGNDGLVSWRAHRWGNRDDAAGCSGRRCARRGGSIWPAAKFRALATSAAPRFGGSGRKLDMFCEAAV